MKKTLFKTSFGLLSISALTIILLSVDFKNNISKYHEQSTTISTGGAPEGRTGAPGETNCTACHSTGTTQDGNPVNELVLNSGGTDYAIGETTPMTLTLTDDAAKNGFQLVALNDNDEMAGTFTITDNTNTKFVTSGLLNRDYVTHTSNGTGLNSWTFDWETPIEGGNITFYVATNKTNSSATNAGDLIYLSQHTFTAPDVSSINEEVISERLDVLYSSQKNAIIADFEIINPSNISFNVVGLDGKSVYFKNANHFVPGEYSEMLRLPDNINNGIYVTTLFVDNKPLSKKIYISRN
jgi:hypothetical protein